MSWQARMLEDGETARATPSGASVTQLGRDSALDTFVPRRRRTDIQDGSGIVETAPSGSSARRDWVFRGLLAFADMFAAAVAIVVGGAMLEADLVNLGSLIGLPLVVVAAKTLGLYDRDELVIHKTKLNDAPKLFYLTTLFTLVYAVQADLQDTTIATETIVVLWLLMTTSVMTARWTARRIARSVTPPERCVLVGDTAHAQRVKQELESHPTLSAELVAVIPFGRVTARGEDAEELGEYLRRSDFHRVIVTHTDADASDMIDTIRIFKSRGNKVRVLPTQRTVDLMGVTFDALTEEEVLDEIFDNLDAGRGGWVVTTNLEILRQQTSVPEWQDLLGEATLVVADGMPLVWASALARTPVPERVAGSSLVTPLCVRAARHGKSVFLIGGAPGTAAQAARLLAQKAPGLIVAGTLCPPLGFEGDPAAVSDIRQRLQAARPDIVLVGLGAPKQEHLIRTLRADLPAAWHLGVGVSFSFITGDVRRAPCWVQRAGLEWIHRFVQEPGRLFRRYFLHGPPFATRLGSWALLQRIRRSRSVVREGSGA